MISEIFFSFSHYKSMAAIYGHGGHLDTWTVTTCINFQSRFNTRLHMKFGLGVSDEKAFKDVDGRTDERTDRRTNDGRG